MEHTAFVWEAIPCQPLEWEPAAGDFPCIDLDEPRPEPASEVPEEMQAEGSPPAGQSVPDESDVENFTRGIARWTQLEDYAGTVTFRTVYPGQGDFTNFVIAGDAILANGTWAHVQNSGTQIYRLAVEVGGDLAVFGTAPDGRAWEIAVRDPRSEAVWGTLRLRARVAPGRRRPTRWVGEQPRG